MADADDVTLAVRMDRPLAEALFQIAEHTGRSVDELISEAVAAAITPASQLDLEMLGQGMLDALAAVPAGHEPEPLSDEDAETMLVALQPFLLPVTATRQALGAELMEQLIGSTAGTPLTADAGARLVAVTEVCQLLRGGYSEAGVRHWWSKPRSHLHGAAPLDLLVAGWSPQSEAFRRVRKLAEADMNFSAS